MLDQVPSADEIARRLADPNAVIGSLNFNLDHFTYKGDLPGASDQSATRLTFQPIFPYPLNDTSNFYLRPAVPIVLLKTFRQQADSIIKVSNLGILALMPRWAKVFQVVMW